MTGRHSIQVVCSYCQCGVADNMLRICALPLPLRSESTGSCRLCRCIMLYMSPRASAEERRRALWHYDTRHCPSASDTQCSLCGGRGAKGHDAAENRRCGHQADAVMQRYSGARYADTASSLASHKRLASAASYVIAVERAMRAPAKGAMASDKVAKGSGPHTAYGTMYSPPRRAVAPILVSVLAASAGAAPCLAVKKNHRNSGATIARVHGVKWRQMSVSTAPGLTAMAFTVLHPAASSCLCSSYASMMQAIFDCP